MFGRMENFFRAPGRVAAALGLLVVAVCHMQGRHHGGVDTVGAPYAAWSLTRTGSFDVSIYPQLAEFVASQYVVAPAGEWISRRPPGSTLATLPVVFPIAMFRAEPFRYETMQSLGKLASALHVGGAVAVFYLLCLRLAPGAAVPATLLFGLGTSLLPICGMAMWMHGPATFWLTVALFAAVVASENDSLPWGLWLGLAAGMSLLNRATVGVFVAATLIPLLRFGRGRALLGSALGILPPLVGLLAYNSHYFDAPFLGGYAHEVANSKPTPLAIGLAGLLIAPSRGLLVYSPALLLVPLGLWAMRSREMTAPTKWLMFAWFGGFLATLVYYARWEVWWGGWCFGPRLLCETMPILCVIFAFAFESLHETWSRSLAKALVALSIAVQLVGIFGKDEFWDERYPNGENLFSLYDTQIQARIAHTLRLHR